ncbi:glycosyltransferase family 4 protein [Psychromonas aquimarina]|uniref:glycosyltransferase family 4 protein n=1 Tax=Psychromonas aquimarina TaxID=444919 RepID=UPI00048B2813|nr:glycosyltransferase family 4 protein [Psychromonas aquimarina]
MLSICLVAHFAYGAVTGGNQGSFGGVERQTTLMAKWLAAKGHKVSLLTWSEGREEDEVIAGINVIKICRQDSGLPGIRFFHPRWTGLNAAMKRADAELYYQNCGEYVTGQVALWCKLNNKKFLYSLASDADADPDFPVMHTFRERLLYKYGLLHADKVITQTKKQMNLLKNAFNLDSTVLPMPCIGPEQSEYTPLEFPADKPTILWAARFHECKRLELFLEAAAEIPEYNFLVAGSPSHDDAYSQGLLEKMDCLDNVSCLGMVARDDMPALYRCSTVFCCSSKYEGFPNTFLEAWSQGLPVISTFDPDDLIKEKKLGVSVTNKEELISALRSLCSNHQQWEEYSANARDYYQRNHAVNQSMELFETVFIHMLADKKEGFDEKD